MGANRSGTNLRLKRKRHKKNVETYFAALEKREQAATAKKPAKPKAAKPAKPKAKAAE